jgi:UPF0176 protein
MPYEVLLFYTYTPINAPQEFAAWLRTLCTDLQLTGRAIVAGEGINATLEGTQDNTQRLVNALKNDLRFADTHIKRSSGDGKSFPKLSVKVRDEIVGTHFPKHIDPTHKTGTRLSPTQLRALYDSGQDFTLIDMRNSYEIASGTFKGAIDPGMKNCRDLPKTMNKLAPYKHKKVVTVCTGGVRCEKMSAYLIDQGFTDVSQLDGGIHTYLEQYPDQDFEGVLYTFDKRVTMDFGNNKTHINACTLYSTATESYRDCATPTCRNHFLACDTCANNLPETACTTCRKQSRNFFATLWARLFARA